MRVFSVTIGPVRPSPPLCHHPDHCSTIPGAVGAQDDKASPRLPLCDLQPSVSPTLELTHARRPKEKLPCRYPRSRSWTGTGFAATPPPEARFTKTAIHSMALYTILPHVARTVRHDCKLPPLGL
jgi:hypothetical protein